MKVYPKAYPCSTPVFLDELGNIESQILCDPTDTQPEKDPRLALLWALMHLSLAVGDPSCPPVGPTLA